MKRKFISVVLAAVMALALAMPAFAASGAEMEAADELYSMGLFKGTGSGFELDKTATRQEAMVMLVRLLGKERTALTGSYSHPFGDVSAWADDYVGYCYQKKLASGYTATRFGGGDTVTVAQYLTFVLRVLGYSPSSGDFIWYSPWSLAEKTGLISSSFVRSANAACTRGSMALISDNALKARLKGTSESLGDYLKSASSASPAVLSSTEIARRCTGAVFYLETYYDIDCTTQYGSASGFFISADGVAVTNYHAIKNLFGAKATLISGETYPVVGVISADVERDLAVIKVSMTAESGNRISKFPYLTLGRSALVEEGNSVYAIGSPLSQSNTMTAGIVSNAYRVVNSSLPYIQVSAATSLGSSGGPLLNDEGKVVGVCSAKFTAGDDMSLCVPIDALMSLSKTGTVYSLYDFAQKQGGVVRDTLCGITPANSEVTVQAGQTVSVVVSTDCVSDFMMSYDTSDQSVALAKWGEQLSKTSCTLLIYGVQAGTASVSLKFLSGYGNPDATAVITVHVV